jgi:transposase-like protein
MSNQKVRSFSREFKLRAVQRMEAGENVSALARELTVKRVILYRWRDAYRIGGLEALRLRGRPSKAEASALAVARAAHISAAVRRSGKDFQRRLAGRLGWLPLAHRGESQADGLHVFALLRRQLGQCLVTAVTRILLCLAAHLRRHNVGLCGE